VSPFLPWRSSTHHFANFGLAEKLLDVLSEPDFHMLCDALTPEMFKAKRQIAGKQVAAVEKKMHRFDRSGKRFDSPQLEVVSRASANTSATASPMTKAVVPVVDDNSISANVTPPPPPLTADGQSLRSDSIPSTTMSAVDELVDSAGAAGGAVASGPAAADKIAGVVVPQIGITDTSELQ
jgi:mRNA-binding protein PUF3